MTSTLRFKKVIFSLKFFSLKKFFKSFLLNSAGRNSTGTITVFSKGAKYKNSRILLHYPNRWDKKLSIVTSIFRNKAKLYFLSKHFTGSLSLKPCVDGVEVGQFIFCSNLPKNF